MTQTQARINHYQDPNMMLDLRPYFVQHAKGKLDTANIVFLGQLVGITKDEFRREVCSGDKVLDEVTTFLNKLGYDFAPVQDEDNRFDRNVTRNSLETTCHYRLWTGGTSKPRREAIKEKVQQLKEYIADIYGLSPDASPALSTDDLQKRGVLSVDTNVNSPFEKDEFQMVKTRDLDNGRVAATFAVSSRFNMLVQSKSFKGDKEATREFCKAVGCEDQGILVRRTTRHGRTTHHITLHYGPGTTHSSLTSKHTTQRFANAANNLRQYLQDKVVVSMREETSKLGLEIKPTKMARG